MMDRVRDSMDVAMVTVLSTAKRREPAQGFIEFALLVVVLVAVASIGLAVLGTDLSTLFSDLAAKLKLPAGF
jgi:Flp pilus assembly pilin Flp